MIKKLFYITTAAAFCMSTSYAAETEFLDTNQREHSSLPVVLQQFVCHESMPGISNNVILKLTRTQYNLYARLIRTLSHISLIVTNEEPSSTTATQGSQESVASTVPVEHSQDSPPSLPTTQPFKPAS